MELMRRSGQKHESTWGRLPGGRKHRGSPCGQPPIPATDEACGRSMTQRSAKESVEAAVREALEKAITLEGYALLVSSSKSSVGLFANRKPVNKKAIEFCLD